MPTVGAQAEREGFGENQPVSATEELPVGNRAGEENSRACGLPSDWQQKGDQNAQIMMFRSSHFSLTLNQRVVESRRSDVHGHRNQPSQFLSGLLFATGQKKKKKKDK